MKCKPTNNYLNYRNFLVLVAVVFLLLITLTSCSNASPPVYTVTFNANGGTIDGEASVQVVGGTAVKEPSAPIRTGYSFDGWCIEGQSETYDFSNPVNSDLTLVAKWTHIYYKVTFNADGGTFSGDASITVASGDTVSIPASSPTKDRYHFDGWYVEGASEAYNFSTPVNSDLTLVAKWTITECIVTFELDGGSFSGEGTVTVDVGKAISKPEDPTKTGYYFDGWFEEGTYTRYDFSSPVNGDLTLVAAWIDYDVFTYTPVTGGYSISQSATALSGLISIPDTYNGQSIVAIGDFSGTSISAVTIPASVEAIGTNAFDSCISLRSVTFESGSKLSEIRDGAFSNTAIESIEIPTSVTAMGTSVFADCNKLQTIKIGTETVPDAWSSGWKEGCNTTVINSKEEAIKYYSVTFKANGGTVDGEPTIKSEVAGGKAVKEPSDPIRTGYSFDGWCIEGQSETYDFSTPVNSDLTLEAKWARIYYKVTFNADGGTFSGDASISVASGDTISSPASSPTKDRYSFDGWYVEGASETYNFSTPVNSNLTLVAKWTITECIVTFKLDGGTFSGEETVTVDVGNAVSKPSVPTKAEYLFAGWFEEGSNTYYDFSTPVNGDLTLVAAWTDPGAFTYTPVTGGYSVSQGTTALSGLIAIPDTYNGQTVIAIARDAFTGNNDITAVTIPASVESIGNFAFYECHSLSTVTIESGSKLSEIKDGVFYQSALTSIEIPASVIEIGESAFEECASLKTVTFESGSKLSKISNYVFAHTAITNIEIPASVLYMYNGVFYNCNSLQEIKIGTETIPETWGQNWKYGCNATVFNSNGEVMGAFIFTKVEGGYSVSQSKVPPSGVLVIPDTYEGQPVVAIENEAFINNKDITAVTIPSSIKSIGSTAFYSCSSLATITFESSSNLSTIGNSAFYNAPIESIKIPASVENMGSYVFYYCYYLETIRIGTESVPGTWDANWNAGCNATVINSNNVTI